MKETRFLNLLLIATALYRCTLFKKLYILKKSYAIFLKGMESKSMHIKWLEVLCNVNH